MSVNLDDGQDFERAYRDEDERQLAIHRDRRERIATAVLTGFAAWGCYPDPRRAASDAIVWADSLIAALDAEGGDE